MSNDTYVNVLRGKKYKIMCDNMGTILRDVLYAPHIYRNLVSVSMLEVKWYKLRFSNSRITIGRNSKVLIKGEWVMRCDSW